MDPARVIWPKRHVSNVRVLIDGLASKTGLSVSELEWDGKPCYGIRWDYSESTKGYPRGFWGHPQWLVISGDELKNIADVARTIEIDKKRSYSNVVAKQ